MRSVSVALPGQEYQVSIQAAALQTQLPALVEELSPTKRRSLVVVSDANVAAQHGASLRRALPAASWCILPAGEAHKNLAGAGRIYDHLLTHSANRSTLLIAFGGGVVGDMAGFAAATFMRGIDLLQVPSTLLAQVDSSIGGKTAVNHPLGKNSIGAFKQPRGVLIDPSLLCTLPPRELRAGLFELIKHALIADQQLLNTLEAEKHLLAQPPADLPAAKRWEAPIQRSCAIKAAVVIADPLERHERALLNFGHTLGHLLETQTAYRVLLHGEAVALGMLFATYLSHWRYQLDSEAVIRIRTLIEPLLPTEILPLQLDDLDRTRFENLLRHDKKATATGLRFIYLAALGKGAIEPALPLDALWPLFQRFCRAYPQWIELPSAADDTRSTAP